MKTNRSRIGAALAVGLCALLAAAAPQGEAGAQEPSLETLVSRLELPPGFRIELVTDQVPGARSLAWSDKGTLFVGTRRNGVVYAVTGLADDWRADRVVTIASDLDSPNGVAVREGALYVAEIGRIIRFDGIENRLDDPPEPMVVYDELPGERRHGWRYMRFGPNGLLYVAVGAPCNACLVQDPFGTIAKINPDGSEFQIFARGIRNSVGFDWHPLTQELWFTDNGRDGMGDDVPPDELNRARQSLLDFGFPYCHAGETVDPEHGTAGDCERAEPPAQKLGPHVAALGMRFYTGEMFPAAFRHQIFIAEHGSWDRSEPIGYRISLVRLDEAGAAASYEPFIQGWLGADGAWGRPVDLEVMPDGSMLVSDDHAGAIYRISYAP
ncbi:MAG: sorbosone dehydrogenase family protein [Alphaproteobacteria bacterium]